MLKGLYIFLFFFFISYSNNAEVLSEVIIKDTTERIIIGKNVWVFQNAEEYTFEQVRHSKEFIQSNDEVPNLGLSPYSLWTKFAITNKSKNPYLLLEIAYPIIDEVELFSPDSEQHYSSLMLGEVIHFEERKYQHPNYIFDLHIPENSSKTYFLRIKATEQIILPISVNQPTILWQYLNKENLISGIYAGIIMIMFFYNLFLFFSVRDKSYLFYVMYVFFVGLTQFGIKGYTFQFLWPALPLFEVKSLVLFACLSGIAGIFFTKKILQTNTNTKKIDTVLTVLIILYSIGFVVTTIGMEQLGFKIMQVITSITSVFILAAAYIIMNKGYTPAKFFFTAWSVLLGGAIIFLLKDYGILPYNSITSNAMQGASAIEMLLLSFALANNINTLKKEKAESQAQALQALQENARIITEQNIILEEKVHERTYELEATNKNLKETQSQLVNAEKMASLGQLTAGIAHEINNPINFVISNIKPLKNDVADIFSLLTKYSEIKNAENLDEKLKEINDFKEKNDTTYLLTEINSLLKGIDEGAFRTAEIVKGLKIFAHLDENDFKKSNIIEGLDSTLKILNSKIKGGKIKVIKEYENQFPKIECHAGQLNQVFMNIINNAIQAMTDITDPQKENILTVKAYTENNYAVIRIKDNGQGIPENVRNKIFDPFFTTKAVGSGTGLGLSISYNIIKNHNGGIITV